MRTSTPSGFGVAFVLFVVGQGALLWGRSQVPDGSGARDVLLGAAIALGATSLGLLVLWVINWRRQRALADRSPGAVVATSGKLDDFEGAVWQAEGRHISFPHYFGVVIALDAISLWRGALAPQMLVRWKWDEVADVREVPIAHGARIVRAVVIDIVRGGHREQVPLYFVGGGIAGLLPRKGSPDRELSIIRSHMTP